jgi:hypothetical protein
MAGAGRRRPVYLASMSMASFGDRPQWHRRRLLALLAALLTILACQSQPVPRSGLRISAAPADWVMHGAFVGDGPDRATLRKRIDRYEALTGKRLAIVHLFIDVTGGFPAAACDEIQAGGATPMLSIAFPGQSLDPILAGDEDSAFRDFATAAAAWGRPVLLRWGWEMNAGHPWSGVTNGGADGGPARYVAAWRRLRQLAAGATNLVWIWCPDAWGRGPHETWNDPGAYYPGAAEVDWLGIDGYAWPSSSQHPPLAIFNDQTLAANLLTRYQDTNKPIIIAETAADRDDPRGAAWTRQLWLDVGRLIGLRAICWFDRDQDGAHWALGPDTEVTQAYREGVQAPYVWPVSVDWSLTGGFGLRFGKSPGRLGR